jgi:general secretion pathway protein D
MFLKTLFLIFFLTLTLYSKEKININFKNLDIQDFIRVTSKIINKNILVTQNIKGKVDFISNAVVYKEDLLDILKYILESKGYTLIQTDAILRVVKTTDLSKYQKKKKITKIKKIVEVINLKHAESKSVFKIISEVLKQRIYKNQTAKPFLSLDEESNSIILIGSKLELEDFILLIKKLDINKPQVYVKARIIEVNEGRSKNIGLKYGLAGGELGSDGLFTFASNTGGSVVSSNLLKGSLDVTNLNRGLALGATINLLKSNQAIDIVSEPSLLCINNKESSIYVGETKSFQVGTTIGTTSTTSYKREDIGLTLKVKPRISINNKVTLQISVVVEDAKELLSGQTNPDTSKKDIKTTAIVKNGEAVILGGYIKNTTDTIEDKVPFFGDIPLFGALFRNNKEVNTKINLVIIITPYIISSNTDLTTLREQLSELKTLEDKYTKDLIVRLEKRKLKIQKDTIKTEQALQSIKAEQKELKNKNIKYIDTKKISKKQLTNKQLHEQRIKEIFGI